MGVSYRSHLALTVKLSNTKHGTTFNAHHRNKRKNKTERMTMKLQETIKGNALMYGRDP